MAIPPRSFFILGCSAANSPSFHTSHLSAIFFCLHFVGGNALSSFPLSSLEGGAEANNILRPLTKHRQNRTEVFSLPERKQNPYPFRRSRPSPRPLSPRKKSRATTTITAKQRPVNMPSSSSLLSLDALNVIYNRRRRRGLFSFHPSVVPSLSTADRQTSTDSRQICNGTL